MKLILEYSPTQSYTVSPSGTGDLIAWVDLNSSLVIWADEPNSHLFHIPTANFVPYYEIV